MRRSVIETVIGAVVLAIAGLFLYYTYTTGYQRVDGYDVTAKFNRVDGISVGSDVRLSGIKIGRVASTQLDPSTYLAILKLRIDRSIKLPVDTTAKITSDSLLGGNYVALEPGAEEKIIPEGGQITSTQDPINVVDLIGRFIFGGASAAKSSAGPKSEGQPPQGEGQPSSGQ